LITIQHVGQNNIEVYENLPDKYFKITILLTFILYKNNHGSRGRYTDDD